MRRFINWLRSIPGRALAYVFESFVSADDRPKAKRRRPVTRVAVNAPVLPFTRSKHDLEKIEAAQQKRARRNAKRAAAHYRPESKKEIADVV